MKLFYQCPFCQNETKFHSFITDRGELLQEKGEKIDLTCNKCKILFKADIDNVYAKQSKLAALISIAVLIVGAPILYFGLNNLIRSAGYTIYTAGVFAIPIAIYSLIKNQDKKRVDAFNNFKVRT